MSSDPHDRAPVGETAVLSGVLSDVYRCMTSQKRNAARVGGRGAQRGLAS